MDSLVGKKLLNCGGVLVDAETVLKYKEIIVYFYSASWCLKYTDIVQRLIEIYQEAKKRKMGLEVIYITFDDDLESMLKFFKERQGGWYAIPFGDLVIQELRLKYNVSHIPDIVVVTVDGTVISKRGFDEVIKLGKNVLITWS